MKKPFIIGITGGSGSGKTSIIKLLRDKFSEAELCLISQDNYYLDRNQQLHDDNGVIIFDLPTCLNEKQFLQAKNFGCKSDIARYEILHKFGVIYVDTDFEALKPIDLKFMTQSFVVGLLLGIAIGWMF